MRRFRNFRTVFSVDIGLFQLSRTCTYTKNVCNTVKVICVKSSRVLYSSKSTKCTQSKRYCVNPKRVPKLRQLNTWLWIHKTICVCAKSNTQKWSKCHHVAKSCAVLHTAYKRTQRYVTSGRTHLSERHSASLLPPQSALGSTSSLDHSLCL